MGDFGTVLQTPGVEEVCRLRGSVGFMAYHGGNLELMTDVIARRAAETSGASLYAVMQPDGVREHFPSTTVDRASSAALGRFLDHVEIVITVHGFGRRGMFGSLLLGGQNREFATHVGSTLRTHLPAYEIITDVDAIPSQLRGMHDRNPVNLPVHRGVQIELPPRVRGTSPLWWDWEGPGLTPHTESLIDGLAQAASTWMTTRGRSDSR
ncbi:poly-gamma-glutamate hydrolase family protein [Ilumatobacter sp.]|uniref:poly-gamma-glutamate hydrolase family protein n=1 Tax=Ilumatobacter sp. TaxID=1967498 RepID=UPI003C5D976B